MISRKRVSVISVCLLLFILASLLLYRLETGKIRNQVHHGTDHEDGRAERLEACRLADGGFLLSDVFAGDGNIMVTCYARVYNGLSGKEYLNAKLPIEQENVEYTTPFSDLVKESSLWDLYYYSVCFDEDIRSSPELMNAITENTQIRETLKFAPGGDFGSFAGFYDAVYVCEALGIDYDRDRLKATLLSDIETRQYDLPSSRYSDLAIIQQMNDEFGLDVDISGNVRRDFEEYGEEISRYYEEGTLPLFMLYEYGMLARAYDLKPVMGDSGITEWFGHYKCEDTGCYGYMADARLAPADPPAMIMACRFGLLYGIDDPLLAADRYFTACRLDSGRYAPFSPIDQSRPEDTYYAYECLRLLDAGDQRRYIEKYLDENRRRDEDSPFYMLLETRAGRPIDMDILEKTAADIAASDMSGMTEWAVTDQLYRLSLCLDLAEGNDTELSGGTQAAILDAARCNAYSGNVIRRYVAAWLLERLGGGHMDAEMLTEELKQALRGFGQRRFSTDDFRYIIYVCQSWPEAEDALKADGECRRLIEEKLAEVDGFGYYNGRYPLYALCGGLMADSFING